MSNITKIGLGVCITGIAAAALGTNPLTLSFLGLIAAGQAITRGSDLGKWCCRRFDSDEDHMRAQVQKLPITLRLANQTLRLIVLPLRLIVKPDGNLPPSISANIPPCSTDGDSTSATSEIAIPNQTQNHTGPDYLSTLPRELCVNIQSFSNDVYRKSMSYTCKRLHEIDDPELADWIADQRWLESKKRVTLAELRERAPGLVSNHSFELVLDNTITDDELLEIVKRFHNISAIDAASFGFFNQSNETFSTRREQSWRGGIASIAAFDEVVK